MHVLCVLYNLNYNIRILFRIFWYPPKVVNIFIELILPKCVLSKELAKTIKIYKSFYNENYGISADQGYVFYVILPHFHDHLILSTCHLQFNIH